MATTIFKEIKEAVKYWWLLLGSGFLLRLPQLIYEQKNYSDKKNLLPLSEEMSQSLFEIAAYCLIVAMSFGIVCLSVLLLMK